MRKVETSIDEETAWRAVEARDARYDGALYYSVRSTGVYCRPSCPSRRPRRDRVGFYPGCEEAEAAGFRPCKRCKPRESMPDVDRAALVERACRIIDTAEEPIALEALAADLGVTADALHRAFKAVTGVTPKRYASAKRLATFKSLVRSGEGVTGALYGAGYGSSSRLYEKEAKDLGMTPAVYRRGGRGMTIEYATANSHLGRMLVAATERGVCAVSFGDDDESLEKALADEYPAASRTRGGEHTEEWLRAILDHLEGTMSHLDLPLDLQATAFQLRVWEELRRIPLGSTRSYSDIAKAVGKPSASRAVARACATNPVALLTPCHRVVHADGSLSGYRWGTERKRILLEREHRLAG